MHETFDVLEPVPSEPIGRRLRRWKPRLRPNRRPNRRGRIDRRGHRAATVHPDPVIVLGTQKSGTTAIASLLAAAVGEGVTDDVFYRYSEPIESKLLAGRMDFATFVDRYRGHFANRIIKEPSFTFLYTGLEKVFPDARYVFVLRDPRDTIRSVLNRLDLPGNLHELDAHHLKRWRPWIGWGLILRGAGLPRGETYIDRLAIRWRVAAELLLAHRERFILVRYEDFRGDKRGQIHQLAAQLDLPVRHDITDRLDVPYQRRGNPSVRWEEFFGPANLQRIDTICGETMRALGYPLTSETPPSTSQTHNNGSVPADHDVTPRKS